jgi:hypothetical protein
VSTQLLTTWQGAHLTVESTNSIVSVYARPSIGAILKVDKTAAENNKLILSARCRPGHILLAVRV